jgi:hypothetical protein
VREAFFILLVIAVLAALTAYRYRRQIRTMREFWRMAKEMRQMHTAVRREVEEAKPVETGKLVNCSKCGTWVPEIRAIRLGRSSVYCSSKCLEKSAHQA